MERKLTMSNILSNQCNSNEALDMALRQGMVIWLAKQTRGHNFYVSTFLKDYKQFQGMIGDNDLKINLAEMLGTPQVTQTTVPTTGTSIGTTVRLDALESKLDTLLAKLG